MKFLSCNNIFLAISLVLLSGFHVFDAKLCSNTLSNHRLSSKILRYEFMTSKNETFKQEMMLNSHFHVTPTEETTWSSLYPRRLLREEDNKLSWNIMYQKIKYSYYNNNNNRLKNDFLKEISLHNVRLSNNSLHWKAQQTNLEYLLMLDVDRLVWSFRKTAGLNTSGSSPYGGWEAPDIELRGHFVGHYMSAMAQMWANTHNETLRWKMSALVVNLQKCQDAMGTGYLSAFPTEFFDRFEALKIVWAPYYTIHKIMAGLLDQYKLAGNSRALKMVVWMADYFYKRVQNVVAKYSIERHWLSLNQETGGMNDVLYQLFSVTGDQKHLLLAHLFDKPCFLGILAMKADDISGFHANTHIPIVIGAQMRYEVTGDELYKEISAFFLDVVNSTHSFATGGTSVSEFWQDPKRLGDKLQKENEESCTTYNMLKVSRNLFRWTKEVIYADYYERALTNGVLSIQKDSTPGVMIYMLPLGHGVSKGISYHGWGTPFTSFWCCYGTGVELFSKLGDSIYFEGKGEVPQLYVIQYISSSLNWVSGQISLTLAVDNVVSWDQILRVKIEVSAKEDSRTAILNLRIPSWTSFSGVKAFLNGDPLTSPNSGKFITISRSWNTGDEVSLQFPLLLRTEFVQDDRPVFSSLRAILYGPFLLAGLSTGDYDIQTGAVRSTSEWITPIPEEYNSHLVSLVQESGGTKFFLSIENQVPKMQAFHQAQNDSYVHATFRLIPNTKISGQKVAILSMVKLEPFDLPGMVLAYSCQTALQSRLVIVDLATKPFSACTLFYIVKGLNAKDGTISLRTMDGCFVYAGIKNSKSDRDVRLSCEHGLLDPGYKDFKLKDAVSFTWNQGLKKYNPISFMAKGLRRSYILEPLSGLKDESYNVYFNITRY